MICDEQLMGDYLQTGNARAFAALYANQAPMVRRFIQKRLVRSADVDDVLQQTFMRLHVARDSYRSGQPLRPWLCTIAANLVRDHLRRSMRRPECELDSERHAAESREEEPEQPSEHSAAIEAAMEHLSEVTRRIMREHFMQERPLVDIARDLGEKPTTVRVRLHRGCKRLRTQLAQ